MQYKLTINEYINHTNLSISNLKKIEYIVNNSNNSNQINDILVLNLDTCNLNFSDKTILIVGNDNNILKYLNNLKFNKIIITLNIDEINFDNINCIVNITNDIKTSRLLNCKSFQYNIPFFDCNIDNYRLSVHSIMPFITDTSLIESLYQDKTYLLCVMNNFPTDYDHTIKWAIEIFEKMKCNINLIKFAYNLFIDNYNIKINNLLDTIEDELWIKKCTKPIPIDFNIDNTNHINFILNTVRLFDSTIEEKDITKQLICDFKDEEIKEISIIFDKNNINHIMWIESAANLRCDNYNIIKPTMNQIKYSCKIIPTPQESLEIAYNLMIIQMIKYFNNYKNLKDYKNIMIDIENRNINQYELLPAKEIKIGSIKINEWDKLIYKQNSTLEEFKRYYENMFNTKISMIVEGSKMIYVDYMDIDTSIKLYDLIDNNKFISMMTEDELDLPEVKFIY